MTEIEKPAFDFVAYLYFLRSDSRAVSRVKKFFSQHYKLVEEKTAAQLISAAGQSHVIKFTDDKTTSIEVDITIAANVIFVVVMWSSPGTGVDNRYQDVKKLVDELEKDLTGADVEVVALSLAVVGGPAAPAELAGGLPDEAGYLGETAWGRIHHWRRTSLRKHHLYLLEAAEYPGAPGREFIRRGMVEIDWPLHRLEREITVYEDRRRTLEGGKSNIDKEINEMLQRKSLTPRADREQIITLEKDIADLSRVYSHLAADLHMVRDSAANLSRQLESLNNNLERYFTSGLNIENTFPGIYQWEFTGSLEQLRHEEADLRLSLESAKEAIDVIRTQVELFRGSEGMALQEQTREFLKQNTALQVAVSVIELVFIFYYTINSWKEVAFPYKVEELPAWIKFGVVGFFSLAMVMMTHQVAKNLELEKKWSLKLVLSIVVVLAALSLMIIVPLLIEQH